MCISYSVSTNAFAERHYLKEFTKKYKRAWEITYKALSEELQRFDSLLTTSVAEIITASGDTLIAKIEFRVAGTTKSRHASGNRCIVAVNKNKAMINILLIYHKTDLGDGNETAKWKQLIKSNYPEYSNLF